MRIDEFKDDLNHRDRHIQTLDEQIADMKTRVAAMKKDLEFKVQEMQRIKSDANDQLRWEIIIYFLWSETKMWPHTSRWDTLCLKVRSKLQALLC